MIRKGLTTLSSVYNKSTTAAKKKMSANNEPLRSSSMTGSLAQEQGDAPEENAGCGSSIRLSSTSRRTAEWTESSATSRRLQPSFMPGVEADMPQGQTEASDTITRHTYTSPVLTRNGFAAFEEIRQQKQLCDVTIRVGDKEYPAHRVVLAGTCPYFRGMFTGRSKCVSCSKYI